MTEELDKLRDVRDRIMTARQMQVAIFQGENYADICKSLKAKGWVTTIRRYDNTNLTKSPDAYASLYDFQVVRKNGDETTMYWFDTFNQLMAFNDGAKEHFVEPKKGAKKCGAKKKPLRKKPVKKLLKKKPRKKSVRAKKKSR